MAKELREVATIFDYLANLTVVERQQLAIELGYSGGYFNLIVAAERMPSELLITFIYSSKFNQRMTDKKKIMTRDMVEQFVEAARESIYKREVEKRKVKKASRSAK